MADKMIVAPCIDSRTAEYAMRYAQRHETWARNAVRELNGHEPNHRANDTANDTANVRIHEAHAHLNGAAWCLGWPVAT